MMVWKGCETKEELSERNHKQRGFPVYTLLVLL